MPRYPDASPSITSMKGSPYSALAGRIARFEGRTFPLHVGDTWMEPPEGCRMEDLRTQDLPGLHRYVAPHGHPALLEALAERVSSRTGVPTAPANLIIAAGGTGGLGAVAGAFVAPGDEVLIAAPYWPLIAGIVKSFHGAPVAVPLIGAGLSSADAVVAAFESRRTERTVAVYLNTPNNPTGAVLPRAWVEAIVRWAQSHDLWIWSDEVYEDFVYQGEHVWARTLAPERTFSAYSFSKAFGMAGNRVGYIVGPEGPTAEILKVATHTFYAAPTSGQVAALRALGPAGAAWQQMAWEKYKKLGDDAADRLALPRPQGSTFLFFDVVDHLDDRGLTGLLEDLVAKGLLVAPGNSFGPYPTHIRLCFTCAPPEIVEEGVEILARRLGR